MRVDDILLVGAAVVGALTILHAVRTLVATRKEFYNDYVARKRP